MARRVDGERSRADSEASLDGVQALTREDGRERPEALPGSDYCAADAE